MQERERTEELYSIMDDFLNVKYDQESLLSVLKALETAYSGDPPTETGFFVNSVKFYLAALKNELTAAINRLDAYILEEVRRE